MRSKWRPGSRHCPTPTPPNWFELRANVLAHCLDSVVDAFIAMKDPDDTVWTAKAAHQEVVILNLAVSIPDRPPDRARAGHDPVICSVIWSGAVPGVDLAGRLFSPVPGGSW